MKLQLSLALIISAETRCQREFVISWPSRNIRGDPSRGQIRPRPSWTRMYKTLEILGIDDTHVPRANEDRLDSDLARHLSFTIDWTETWKHVVYQRIVIALRWLVMFAKWSTSLEIKENDKWKNIYWKCDKSVM